MTEAASTQAPAAVVITTYNHARFLGDAIASVLAQTVGPAQIVVVDDGSSDHPEKVLADHSGVEMIRQQNRGLASARNTGWRASRLPFVLFLDADDELRPQAIELSLRCLAGSPQAAFSYGAYATKIMPSGKVTEVAFRPVPPEAFAAFLRENPVGMHGTVVYRRQRLEEVGGFRETLWACEDYELYLRLALHHQVAHTPEVLADYRQHDSNMSADPALMLKAYLRVLRRYRPAAAARGLLADYRTGRRDGKLHYVTLWGQRLRRDGLNLRACRQGITLFRLAPWQLLQKISSAVAARLRWRR